ncbi:MAG: hypothetical protein KF718_10550 [Polyangiaceae bacterium]|nr:hypothetical protein [Polyangiaceae bacterium]
MRRAAAAVLLTLGCASLDTGVERRAGSAAEVRSVPGIGSPLLPELPAPSLVADRAATEGAPGTSRPGYLKGQTHVHTERSHDAKTPPEQVLAFYAERGYDFVALTDHNRITVVEPPAGLLLVPGVELTHNATICKPRPPPGYRCLFHTTALFVDPARDEARGERIRFPFALQRQQAFEVQMELTEQLGGLTVLNHPSFHFAADARTIAKLAKRGLAFVEVWNAGLDPQHPRGRTVAESAGERLWDDVLGRGARVFALATDDAHHFADKLGRVRQGKFAYTGDRAWIHVRAEKRPDAIRAAMLAGDFYASTGVELADAEVTPQHTRVRVKEPAQCSIRFTGSGGRLLREAACPEATYVHQGSEGYVRATVEAPGGKRAWLQPAFLGPSE